MHTSRPTLTLALVFAVVGFVTGCGIAQYRIPAFESIGGLASGLVISFATFAWFRSDSAHRLYPSSRMFNIAFVGFTIFVLPYYLVRSRGIWGGTRAVGAAVSIYVLYVITMLMGTLFVRVLRI